MGSDNHQHQRRRFFYGILGAIFVASLAVAVLPVAEAEQTVGGLTVETGSGDPSALSLTPAASEPTATVVVPEPAPSSTVAPTTTATKLKPTTTTTKPKRPITTTTTTTKAPAKLPATTPPPPSPPLPTTTGGGMTAKEAAVLACIRRRESGGNYSIVSANGLYYGAYQFMRSTWDSTARLAGRTELVGVVPSQASPADQDAMALFLYRRSGSAPWGGAC